jgi:Skp family chaperone for outer membrane proteins
MFNRVLVVAMVCFVSAASVSAQIKVGYINSDVILVKYEGAKEAAEKLNKEVAKWEQEASKRQNELKSLKEKIEKQSLLLSAERKKELEDSFQQKYALYQQFVQEKFGQKGAVASKNEELSKPIVDKVNKIIEKIAKAENYDFIFDARAGGLVYANAQKYDLTERVLMLLNKEK